MSQCLSFLRTAGELVPAHPHVSAHGAPSRAAADPVWSFPVLMVWEKTQALASCLEFKCLCFRPRLPFERFQREKKKPKSASKTLICPSMASFVLCLESEKGREEVWPGSTRSLLAALLGLGVSRGAKGLQRKQQAAPAGKGPDSIMLRGERGQPALCHGLLLIPRIWSLCPWLSTPTSPNSFVLAGVSAGNEKVIPGGP